MPRDVALREQLAEIDQVNSRPSAALAALAAAPVVEAVRLCALPAFAFERARVA